MRPNISISLTPFDILLEVLGYLVVLGIWAFTLLQYNQLPETIPTHFNAMGQADGFGNKSEWLRLPIVATVIFMVLTVLNRFPQAFNYAVTITPLNAQKQYQLATRLIRTLKIIIPLVFAIIMQLAIHDVEGGHPFAGIWLLLLVVAVVMVPLVLYLYQSIRTT